MWVDGARRVAGGRLVGHELRALAGEARALATDLVERAGLHGESVIAGGRGRAFDGVAEVVRAGLAGTSFQLSVQRPILGA